jgi:cell division protein FtsW
VLGLLPITGVPLPLVSYGGSSLVPTLTALGMVLAFARNEPGARRALRRRLTAEALRKR